MKNQYFTIQKTWNDGVVNYLTENKKGMHGSGCWYVRFGRPLTLRNLVTWKTENGARNAMNRMIVEGDAKDAKLEVIKVPFKRLFEVSDLREVRPEYGDCGGVIGVREIQVFEWLTPEEMDNQYDLGELSFHDKADAIKAFKRYQAEAIEILQNISTL